MFRSFFLASFEGSSGRGRTADSDYAELSRRGIQAVRECARWPQIDLGRGKYDFASLDPLIRAANRHRIDVVWDLFRCGWPDGLDPLGRAFRLRFADYCFEAGRYIADHSRSTTCWFMPLGARSFRAMAGEDVAALCRAAIAGIEALWVGAPECRIVNAGGRRFAAWDIIAGRLHPELGGSQRHLDVVGLDHPELLRPVWERYGHEMIVTAALDPAEAESLLADDVPLGGACLDAVLERPEADVRSLEQRLGQRFAALGPALRPAELVRRSGRY